MYWGARLGFYKVLCFRYLLATYAHAYAHYLPVGSKVTCVLSLSPHILALQRV